MPLRFLTEMFCDRVAASKIYKGNAYTDGAPLAYFLHGNAGKKMHAQTAQELEKWLRMLASEGEEKTFAYIRALNRKASAKSHL